MKRTADRLFGARRRPFTDARGGPGSRLAATSAWGLEDNLWTAPGELAPSNAAQMTKVRAILEGLGLGVATPDEARAILSLKGGDQVGF